MHRMLITPLSRMLGLGCVALHGAQALAQAGGAPQPPAPSVPPSWGMGRWSSEPMGMMGSRRYDGHACTWGHGVWAAVVLVALLVGVLLLLRSIRQHRCMHGDMYSGRPDPTRSALHILGERFARGEIDQAEFEQRRSALMGVPDKH